MTENLDPDAQLMLRFTRGDESCFIELVKSHKQRVFAFSYRFLGNAADAEDAAQEVFIKIYNARQKYAAKAKFTTWLFVITRNTCMNYLNKRNKSGLVVALDDYQDEREDAPALQVADAKDPQPIESILNDERAAAVKQALDSLPESQKTAVLLSRYEELSYEAIAEAMGCSVKAVKSLLHRAKTGLKEKLAGFLRT